MTVVFATAGPSAYWYLTRATGTVALLLLTASVVLGVLGPLRFSCAPRWPRFTIDMLHRDVSLMAIAFLAVHIATGVLDSFAPIRLIDAVIPFASAYRPLWIGLGAVAFDIMVALVVTSLARRSLGYGAWRAIHWLAYVSWPVAVLHGLGTGSDVKSWWMLLLTIACLAAVVIAGLARTASADPGLRAGAAALSIAVPLGIAVFALAGPLQHGWARRAGTPARLLAGAVTTGSTLHAARPAPAASTLSHSFSASLSGTVAQRQAGAGAIVELSMRLSGAVPGHLRVRLGGTPLVGGGLSMTGSQVDLSTVGGPSVLEGQIVSLEGRRFLARVTDQSGLALNLNANLNLDNQGGVTGTLSGAPAGGGG